MNTNYSDYHIHLIKLFIKSYMLLESNTVIYSLWLNVIEIYSHIKICLYF